MFSKTTPAQNAQRYFKKYQKARNARQLAAEQIRKTSEELSYLEGQMDNLGKCTGESELRELRDELEKFGYVKPNSNRRAMKQLPPSVPMRFTAPCRWTYCELWSPMSVCVALTA